MMNEERMSVFEEKKLITGLMQKETPGCGFDVVLGFESGLNERILRLRLSGDRKLEVNLNLGHIGKSLPRVRSLKIKAYYCALFASEYIRILGRAKREEPGSYFEGLSFLDSVVMHRSEKLISVWSPTYLWDRRLGKAHVLRPLEVSAAINALNKIRIFLSNELTEDDRLAVEAICERFISYSGLPEVSYIHSRVPDYSAIDALWRVLKLAEKEPGIGEEFPILSMLPLDERTTDGFFKRSLQTENEFINGIALRLVAFLRVSPETELSEEERERLAGAFKKFMDFSLSFCRENHASVRPIERDNLIAIKTACRAINRYLGENGTEFFSGNIHTVI
ncbi:MAG: hypothetical protein LUG86_01410 [Oscillospiraceae bacterium]|nr:hypothetical protein [Oscillospiraceae bacterium]